MSTPPPSVQIAGHIGAFTRLDGGRIRKQVKKEEAQFYRSLGERQLDSMILNYIPKFYGIEEHDGQEYIIIEDLTAVCTLPTLMDMKMGTSSVDPTELDPAKRAYMDNKDRNTTTFSLGMRVSGVNIQNVVDGSVFQQGKPWGQSLTPETMPNAVAQFFNDGNRVRVDVARYFLSHVNRILTWWSRQNEFCLYSSSLLFVYDASVEHEVKADIRIIDFAHVIEIEDDSLDEGMIFGLKNLAIHLEELISEHA